MKKIRLNRSQRDAQKVIRTEQKDNVRNSCKYHIINTLV